MKKLSFFLLAPLFAFYACSNDNDETPQPQKEVVVSFENQLTEAESEFISTSQEVSGYYFKDVFKDPSNLLKFDHYYSTYSFAGFTYSNKQNHARQCVIT